MIEPKSDYQLFIDTLRDVLVLTRTHDGFKYEDADAELLTARLQQSAVYAACLEKGIDTDALTRFVLAAFALRQALPVVDARSELRTCEHCGKLFRPKRWYFTYCGYSCAEAAKHESEKVRT